MNALASLGPLFSRLLTPKVVVKGTVLAVDISEDFPKHIQERAREQNLANIQTVLCKQDSVELPDASVDLVYRRQEYRTGDGARPSRLGCRRGGDHFWIQKFRRIALWLTAYFTRRLIPMCLVVRRSKSYIYLTSVASLFSEVALKAP